MLKETFELLNRPQCEAYLKRLSLPWPRKADRAFLDALIERHLAVIPFENLNTALLHLPKACIIKSSAADEEAIALS